MKKYHEVAYIRDQEKTTGYIVKEGSLSDTTPFRIMDLDQFRAAVSKNLVQFYTLKDGEPVVEYTPEEYRALGCLPAPTGNEYRKRDASFEQAHIDALLSEGKGILKVLSVVAMPLAGHAVCLLAFAPKAKIRDYVEMLRQHHIMESYWGMTLQDGGNNLMFSLPIVDMDDQVFLKDLKQGFYTDLSELDKDRDMPGWCETDKGILRKVKRAFL